MNDTGGGTWLWWSSGKDSAWALAQAEDVTALVTTVTPTFGRVAVHGTRIEVLEAQARALGLPMITVELPYPCSNDDYVAAVQPVLERARAAGARMAFGDLFLEDVRAYREALLAGSGVDPVFPLWLRPTPALAAEMLDAGVEAHIVCLDPTRVPREFAGQRFDRALLRALPGGVDPCGENGEFHTCVVDGPMFNERISVEVGETVEREGFVYTDVLLASSGVEGS